MRHVTEPVQPSFYDAIGGEETFTRLVSAFYAGVAQDPLLRPLYPEEDLGAGSGAVPDVSRAVLGRAA